MKVLFESDRECTIDGVGLLEPGVAVEVDPILFRTYHSVEPAKANLPPFIQVTCVVPSVEKKSTKSKKAVEEEEGGE